MTWSKLGTVIVLAASLGLASTASAVPIQTAFNFVPTGLFTADTGNITTATTIAGGAPYVVTTILLDNIGLTSGTLTTLTDPAPLSVGAVFQKTFTTPLGTFTETLTVNSRQPGLTSVGIVATGTIDDGPGGFDPTPVFYSAAYTQNGGPGAQINGSFNNSTIPPRVPEPASLVFIGGGLACLALLRGRRSVSR